MHTEEEKDRKKCRIMSHKVISEDVPARLNLETGQWLDANKLLHTALRSVYLWALCRAIQFYPPLRFVTPLNIIFTRGFLFMLRAKK